MVSPSPACLRRRGMSFTGRRGGERGGCRRCRCRCRCPRWVRRERLPPRHDGGLALERQDRVPGLCGGASVAKKLQRLHLRGFICWFRGWWCHVHGTRQTGKGGGCRGDGTWEEPRVRVCIFIIKGFA